MRTLHTIPRPAPSSLPKAELLRKRYETEIQTKKAEIRKLEERLSVLADLENEAANAELPLNGEESGKYAEMPLSQACLDIVSILCRRPGVKAVSATEVGQFGVENGLKYVGANLRIRVDSCLRKWVSEGKLVSQMTDGRRLYYPLSPEHQS